MHYGVISTSTEFFFFLDSKTLDNWEPSVQKVFNLMLLLNTKTA